MQEIPLSSIVCLEPAGTNTFPWKHECVSTENNEQAELNPNYASLTAPIRTQTQREPFDATRPIIPDHVFEMRCVDGMVYFVGQLAYGEVLDNGTDGAFSGKSRRKSHFPVLPSVQSYTRKASAPLYGLVHLSEPLPNLTSNDSKLTLNWSDRASRNCVEEIDRTEGVYRAAILPPPPGTGLDVARHLETALRQSLLPLTSKSSTQTIRSLTSNGKQTSSDQPASSPVCDLIPDKVEKPTELSSNMQSDSNPSPVEDDVSSTECSKTPSMSQLEIAADDEEGTGECCIISPSSTLFLT